MSATIGDSVQTEPVAASDAVAARGKDRPTTPPTAGELGKLREPGSDGYDLSDPALYLNRELTWLNFNWRVLHEAEDERTPLLERLKFVAIVGSNLDEFLMKRIGGLKQQIGAKVTELTVDGRTPEQQVNECMEVVLDLRRRQRQLLLQLRQRLKEHGIYAVTYDELSDEQKNWLREHFRNEIFPLVTPQASDPAHPFPFVSNLSINLFVTVRNSRDQEQLVRVKAPIGPDIPGIIQIADTSTYVMLEEIIANNLDLLFPGMDVLSCEFFRVIRNANTETDEESAEDLLAMIESELRDRQFAPVVSMDVVNGMSPLHEGMLAAEMGLNEATDVTEVDPPLDRKDFMDLAMSLDRPDLRDAPHHPIDHPELTPGRNIFHVIREKGAVLLHHPYESFSTSVERFLKTAARDPKVRAIKMALYRTARRSRVIKYLVEAAANGKQVAVVVELKARFDERANIEWARHLEQAGIHVTFGVVGLKTHCKVILVIRRDYSGLRRYAHIGTGNYHSGTARLYGDLGLLTCDPELTADIGELFNFLTTGFMAKRRYNKLLTSPRRSKAALLYKIKREIALHTDENPGLIQFKMNALEDVDITRALYQASMAGVRIDLIVRDTCRLRPGIAGLSDTVRVVSVVGRFLEHTRIYHFGGGGEPEYFIGSADCMKRNLESRVEALAPVEDPRLQEHLQQIIDIQLADQRSAWEMRSDGSYIQRIPLDESQELGSQQQLIELARQRQATYQKGKNKALLHRTRSHRTRIG